MATVFDEVGQAASSSIAPVLPSANVIEKETIADDEMPEVTRSRVWFQNGTGFVEFKTTAGKSICFAISPDKLLMLATASMEVVNERLGWVLTSIGL